MIIIYDATGKESVSLCLWEQNLGNRQDRPVPSRPIRSSETNPVAVMKLYLTKKKYFDTLFLLGSHQMYQ